MPLTGTRETRTKPVTTVPAIAPSVPTPDRRPTTVPVSCRLRSWSFTTTGLTAESSAPGTRIDSVAASSSSPGLLDAAAPRTADGVSATATPETPSNGPSRWRGDTRSAVQPPVQVPAAIAVSASPMTSVLVSRVRP